MKQGSNDTITILGGGPAGLAAAFYARRSGMTVQLFEAGDEVGGNARTLQMGEFAFDTGAHRWHDRHPDITADIQQLLGDDLLRVHVPSQIYLNGRFLDFPLSPLDIITGLDHRTLSRIVRENFMQLFRRPTVADNFRDLAINSYGPTLARLALLGYSEKLWGAAPERLSTQVAGRRIRGLDLKTFLLELLPGNRAKTEHLDGAFYYPKQGIGRIAERVAEQIGGDAIRCGARVSRLLHEGERITAIEINRSDVFGVDTAISTIPLPALIAMLDPAPPQSILDLAGSIRYRHLVLLVLALDRPQFTPNASLYFPDAAIPFTRVFEPKNRSRHLAPPDRTVIVVEIPCDIGDQHWTADDATLLKLVADQLQRTGLLRNADILQHQTHRVPFAYPVLEVGYESKVNELLAWLGQFCNLHLTGRSALFQYSHIHDLFRMGKEIVEAVESGASRTR